eukprot:scaffold12962_cov135-Isochrysis_galbana.AAC.5
MVPILKVREHARVKVGHVVVDPLSPKLLVITKVTRQPLRARTRCAPCVSRARGSARGHPSPCTSVSVIGLFLAYS